MKKILLVLAVVAFFASCSTTPDYVKVTEKFMDGVLKKDTTLMKPYCTDNTFTTMKFMVAQDAGRTIHSAEGFKFQLVKDQVSTNGDTAWVWFLDANHPNEKFKTRLVKYDGQWKVDEPK